VAGFYNRDGMCLLRGTCFSLIVFHVNFSSLKGQVRSQVSPREIYATDTGFSPRTSVSLCQCRSPSAAHMLLWPWGQTGEGWEPSKKKQSVLFQKSGRIG